MDNLALQIIDEELPQEGFAVDNDNLAEWAIKKIAEERAETQRYINVCDTMINEYELKKQKAKEQLKTKTAYLINSLNQYFQTVKPHETKTQKTYKLPSGTLRLKHGTPEFIRDEEALLKWAKENAPEQVKVKETVNWGELKKSTIFKDGMVITADGEVVEGVKAIDRPDTFEVVI